MADMSFALSGLAATHADALGAVVNIADAKLLISILL
jgi:hypothetical protein